MNKYDLTTVHNISDRTIFFDANILMYLFWSTGSSWEASYSTLYSKLSKINSSFAVHFVVVSEFVNRAIKTEYNKHLQSNNLISKNYSYKQYRNSSEGQETIQDVYTLVMSKIISKFEIIGKSFLTDDIQKMLVLDSLDFSDKAIVEICKSNNFVLLTNDSDFKDSDLDILSLNKRI